MVQLADLADRDRLEFDVVIVGAGPAGLAAAIRLKQLDSNLSVVVLEKGSEVGAHVLSGAVVDPIGFDTLLPGWRQEADHPFKTAVAEDRFLVLSQNKAFRLPGFLLPPLMGNHGNFIVSLGDVCRWLARKAEALGVEIYPGFAATELAHGDDGAVVGVLTGDMGIRANGTPGGQFVPGVVLVGQYVLLGEGARGSLAKQAIWYFDLESGHQPPKFGIGLKELWEVDAAQHRKGLVQHSFGWPLRSDTGGGSFLYHLEGNLVAVGLVVHLDYKNPWLSPFDEFQRLKTHPTIQKTFVGAKRIGYGARVISEGGWQSIPKTSFPGGLLLGCSAGLVNLPRIKGSHNAVLSGMLAAEHVANAIHSGIQNGDLSAYDSALRHGPIGKDLKRVRNAKPLWSRFGTVLGIGLGGFDMWCQTLLGFSPFGTLRHKGADANALEAADRHNKIEYPRADNLLTFDRLSSVFISGTHHAEDQPPHLRIANMELQVRSELATFAGPSMRYCPAGVYEWLSASGEPWRPGEQAGARLVVNSQNCIHCKTCDVKDPKGNISWVPPQGGEGPTYSGM